MMQRYAAWFPWANVKDHKNVLYLEIELHEVVNYLNLLFQLYKNSWIRMEQVPQQRLI